MAKRHGNDWEDIFFLNIVVRKDGVRLKLGIVDDTEVRLGRNGGGATQ